MASRTSEETNTHHSKNNKANILTSNHNLIQFSTKPSKMQLSLSAVLATVGVAFAGPLTVRTTTIDTNSTQSPTPTQRTHLTSRDSIAQMRGMEADFLSQTRSPSI